MGEHRRSYPAELKRSALELVRTSGKSATAVAKDLGIDPGVLNRWRREEAQETGGRKAFTGQGVPRDEELARLQREVELPGHGGDRREVPVRGDAGEAGRRPRA